jgi:hypothetical protein
MNGFLRRLFGRADPPERDPSAGAPDAEPEDVPYPGRTGFDGRPIEPGRGGLTGLEGGNAGGPKPPAVPNA